MGHEAIKKEQSDRYACPKRERVDVGQVVLGESLVLYNGGRQSHICENGEKRNDDRSNGHYSEIIRRKQSCQNTGHNQ